MAKNKYDEHISYFGGTEQYAKAIKEKEAAGQTLTDPGAAAAFKTANPGLFSAPSGGGGGSASATPAVKPYQEHISYFGSPQRYAEEIIAKENAGIPLSDTRSAALFRSENPQYFPAKVATTPQQTSILQQLQQRAAKPAQYNPATDPAYQAMSGVLARNVMELMNQRGILNSSITEDEVAQAMAGILPQLQQQFYSNQQQQTGNLFDLFGAYSGLEGQAYGRQTAAEQQTYERQMTERQMQIDQQARDLERAWDRVNNLGYVDNVASITLGVPVGTLSAAAREAYDARKQQLALARENNAAAMAREQTGNAAAMARTQYRTPYEQAQDEAANRYRTGAATPEDLSFLGIKTQEEKKQEQDLRKEAVSLAQKDPEWEEANAARRTAIVNDYISMLGGKTAPGGEAISDEDLLQFTQ